MGKFRKKIRIILNDGEKISVEQTALCFLGIVAFIVLIYFLSIRDTTPQELLESRGYNLDGITFTKIETDALKNTVFQSSDPLPLGNGEMCDLWERELFLQTYFIYPYPSGEWPATEERIVLTLTIQEYQQIEEKASGTSVEKYIKETILNQ